MLEERLDRDRENKSQTREWEEQFHRDVLQELWEMVKIIKQEDKAEHRSELQSYCQKLLKMGQGRPFSPAWNQLLEISNSVLANPENVYRNSGKLIVKEIKQAADLVLAGQGKLIKVSESLKSIALINPANGNGADPIESNSLPEIKDEDYNRIDIEEDLWSDSENGKQAAELAQEEETQAQLLDGDGDAIDELEGLLEEDESDSELNASLEDIQDLEDLLGTEDDRPEDEYQAISLQEDNWEDLSLEDFSTSLDNDNLDLEGITEEISDPEAEERENLAIEGNEAEELEDLLGFDDAEAESSQTLLEENTASENQILYFYEEFDRLEELLQIPSALLAQEIDPNAIEALEATIASEFDADLESFVDSTSIEETEILDSFTTLEELTGEADGLEEFSDLDDLLDDEPAPVAAAVAAAPAAAPVAAAPVAAAPAKTVQARKAPPKRLEQNMRVPVKQLDNLNNLIGELVVKRNSLEQDQQRLHGFLDNLLSQVQSLSDVGGRMQEQYEKSLLEGALMASRSQGSSFIEDSAEPEESQEGVNDLEGFGALDLDRFTPIHILSQEMIELIVRVRESASDIQFLVDETEEVSRSLRQVTTQLQEGMTKCRMVAFSQTADRLPRAVRDISFKLNKKAKLELEGRDVLIDKMILESLYDPMTHLVNNAMTHGVETPEERQANGKQPEGTIRVKAFFQGNQTVISVSDDGAGINPERVRNKAVEKGLIGAEEAKELSKQEIYDFLFHPGFSTRDQADDFAGRGVGMDVVRSKLNAIRGTISTESKIGHGTTFTIRLPLTLSISKALCCLSDHSLVAFPMDGVEDTQDFAPSDIEINEEGKKCVRWRDNLLPFRPLNELLLYNYQIGRSSVYGGSSQEDTTSIVVLRAAGKLLAVQVDRIEGEQEIVIKQIQGPIPKPAGVAGATVLGDGRIMPIADVLELIEISQGIRSIETKGVWRKTLGQTATSGKTAPKKDPMVLIVDDSITVRELLSLSFSKVGYRVEQARDGQEAWEKLKSGLPCDLIFCDIEMPKMNGLELLSNIQKDRQLSEVPVAMLTSRGADRHQQLAAKLGASGYFIKPYTEKDLLDAAQRMIEGEILLAGSSRKPKATKPKEDKQTATSKQKQAKPSRSKHFEPRVLVVDDSVIVREMVSMTFSKAGYKVEQARDGQEAWEKLSSGLPCDLIVCDIEMPRMNGLEFLSHVQEDPNLNEVPVAMLTSRGAQKMKKIAAQRGAKAYFVKPYMEDVLLESAKKLLDGEILLDQGND